MLPFTEQRYASALNGILKMFFLEPSHLCCLVRMYPQAHVFLD